VRVTPAGLWWDQIAPVGVILCWLGTIVPFVLRKRPPAESTRKRDRFTLVGIFFQSLGYAAVWCLQRPFGTPMLELSPEWSWIPPLAAMALGGISVYLTVSALATLGKQWSIVARVAEGHRLVTEGPYRFIRHPIYTAMLGMLLATGLAFSYWFMLPPALLLFSLGMAIRVRREEALLRETFGPEFEAYARRVGAVFPRMQ